MNCDMNRLFSDEEEILSFKCDVQETVFHSFNHIVIFQLPMVSDKLESRISVDKWDNDHVRMPYSNESKFVEVFDNNEKSIKPRWDLIQTALLKNEFTSSYDLEAAIKSYNTRYESIWSFEALHEFVNRNLDREQRTKFLKHTLPQIVNLALRLPDLIQCPIPLLKQGMNKSISMSQEQAASILANGFLCTFPRRNTTKKNAEYANYSNINFQKLYSGQGQNVIEKLKCIINYFDRVIKDMPNGVITFTRKSIDPSEFPNWKEDLRNFKNTKYTITSKYKIEDASQMLQVDFSNKKLGGGILGNGCVQEEIRFCLNPELIVARLFAECLDDNESFLIIGTEQFSMYVGYASNFQFAGNFIDKTPSDSFRRKKTRIIAMDALRYKNNQEQFRDSNLYRELNKAYAGFHGAREDNQPVATGLWGSGAFGGHPIKSAIIQLMACRATSRNLLFCTFNDENLKSEIESLIACIVESMVTVSRCYSILKEFYLKAQGGGYQDLINHIHFHIQTTVDKAKNVQANNSSFNQQRLLFNMKKTKPSTSQSPLTFSPEHKVHVADIQSKREKFQFARFDSKLYTAEDDKKKFDNIRNTFKTPLNNNINIQKQEEKKIVKHNLLDALNEDFDK